LLEEFKLPRPPEASASDKPKGPGKTSSTAGVLATELKRVFGVDLTKIPGIRVGIAQTLFGEIGPDFTKFRSASAFASWMGLCPDNDISGGKVLWVGTRKVKCRAATALRLAAQSLHHSKSALGDFYRRMRAKLGAPKAITAAAHKLARIIFHLITTGQEFDDSKFAADQLRYHKNKRQNYGPRPRLWVSHSSPANQPGEFLRSDTSPVSNLALIDRLDLLRVQFELVWIPNAMKTELDRRGEAEAIALPTEIPADVLLIDERDGRVIAAWRVCGSWG